MRARFRSARRAAGTVVAGALYTGAIIVVVLGVGGLLVPAEAAQGGAGTTSTAIGGVLPPESLTVVPVPQSRFTTHTVYMVVAASGEVVSLGLLPPQLCPCHEDMVLLSVRTAKIADGLQALRLQVTLARDAIAKLIITIQSEPPNPTVLSQWRTIYNDWTGPGGTGVDPDGGDLDGDGDADLKDVWMWRPQRVGPDR